MDKKLTKREFDAACRAFSDGIVRPAGTLITFNELVRGRNGKVYDRYDDFTFEQGFDTGVVPAFGLGLCMGGRIWMNKERTSIGLLANLSYKTSNSDRFSPVKGASCRGDYDTLNETWNLVWRYEYYG